MLTEEEQSALKESMSESAEAQMRRPAERVSAPTPVALVADDRAAERARPAARRLANRWAKLAQKQLRRLGNADLEIALDGVSLIRAGALRSDLEGAWGGGLRVPSRKANTTLWVVGPVIEASIAQLLGETEAAEPRREPSAIAVRIFDEIGSSLLDSYSLAWAQEEGCRTEVAGPVSVMDVVRELEDEPAVLVATLALSGPFSGSLRLVGPTRAFVLPARPARAVPVPRGVVRSVLGEVPIELCVELGCGELTPRRLASLKPGDVLPLNRLIGDSLPVLVGEQVRARVQPVLRGDALAVQVCEPIDLNGGSTK